MVEQVEVLTKRGRRARQGKGTKVQRTVEEPQIQKVQKFVDVPVTRQVEQIIEVPEAQVVDEIIEVPCAVSTDAMDRIEGKTRSGAAAREEQFFRLRATIEARAAQKVAAVEFEGTRPGVILRSIDFPPA